MAKYTILSNRADILFASSCQPFRAFLQCRAGCCSCCTLSSVLSIEAIALARAIMNIDPDKRTSISIQANKEEMPHCPMLLDGLCTIYSARPLICRTHGAPLAYIGYRSESIEISACPLNFPSDFVFDTKKLLFMDELNAELLALNQQLLSQQTGKAQRIPISEVVLQYRHLSTLPS